MFESFLVMLVCLTPSPQDAHSSHVNHSFPRRPECDIVYVLPTCMDLRDGDPCPAQLPLFCMAGSGGADRQLELV